MVGDWQGGPVVVKSPVIDGVELGVHDNVLKDKADE
jgi:hypothetical protein